jgi:hypothetical protein
MELAWGSQEMGCHTLSILIIIAIFGNIRRTNHQKKLRKSFISTPTILGPLS